MIIILPFPLIIHLIMSETKKGGSETSEKMLTQPEIRLCGRSTGRVVPRPPLVTPRPPKGTSHPASAGRRRLSVAHLGVETGLFPTSWSLGGWS